MASVTLKGIYKKYAGGVTAVSDFNLDIEDKEFIILVGPSGCGKSTTSATDWLTTSPRKTAISQWFSRTMRCILT